MSIHVSDSHFLARVVANCITRKLLWPPSSFLRISVNSRLSNHLPLCVNKGDHSRGGPSLCPTELTASPSQNRTSQTERLDAARFSFTFLLMIRSWFICVFLYLSHSAFLRSIPDLFLNFGFNLQSTCMFFFSSSRHMLLKILTVPYAVPITWRSA